MSKDFIVHHDGALGDVILSLPVIKSIYEDNEPCRIHLIGRPPAVSLLRLTDLHLAATSSDLSLFASLYTKNGYKLPFVKDFFKPFKSGFIFSRFTSSTLIHNLLHLIPDTRVIRTIPESGERKHVTEFQLNQIDKTIEQNQPITIDLDQDRAKNLISAIKCSTIIGIHPGSGGRKKCWPVSYFVQWMNLTRKRRPCQFVVFTGPAEERLINDFRSLCSHHDLNDDIVFVENQPINVAASLLSRCTLYLGNDSGITHLAALTAKRVAALFGPTDPAVWAPLGEHVKVIQSSYTCAPCNKEKYKNCNEQKCLSELSVNKVWKETESFF